MQYIGRLMRDVDPAPIRAALDAWAGASRAETPSLHQLERWRERLSPTTTALTAFADGAHCGAQSGDVQQLRDDDPHAPKEHAEDGRRSIIASCSG